ncbi:MAG: hypothetical protein Q4G40_12805 [Brachybacterium sp.]|nr:hypothetical protein [Brachybacterium sp.]
MDVRRIMQDAMGTAEVDRKLRARANRIRARAASMAVRERGVPSGYGSSLRVETGRRPGVKAQGFRRPYARVVAPHGASTEFGGARGAKLRLLLKATRATR